MCSLSQDPSVMSASLCALYDCMRTDTRPYKNLIPSFTSILKQVGWESIMCMMQLKPCPLLQTCHEQYPGSAIHATHN